MNKNTHAPFECRDCNRKLGQVIRTKIYIAVIAALCIPLASCGGSDSGSSTASTKVKNFALPRPSGFGRPATTVAPTTTVLSCANGGVCARGDKGPGGGTVFYVGPQPINQVEGVSGGGRSLEILNLDSEFQKDPYPTWGCRRTEILDSKDQTLGAGAKSTKAIVDKCTTPNIYAKIALDLTKNGKSDWFMPSADELLKMCIFVYQQPDTATACDVTQPVRSKMESFVTRVWTSNEGNYEYGQTYDLRYGKTSGVRKDTSAATFAVVRAFG